MIEGVDEREETRDDEVLKCIVGCCAALENQNPEIERGSKERDVEGSSGRTSCLRLDGVS